MIIEFFVDAPFKKIEYMKEMIWAFYPLSHIVQEDPNAHVKIKITKNANNAVFQLQETETGRTVLKKESFREDRYYLKRKLYEALETFSEKKLAWGIATGIRPVHLADRILKENGGQIDPARKQLKKDYKISDTLTRIMVNLALLEQQEMEPLDEKKMELYVNIPFCPSRCSYCSFITREASGPSADLRTYLDFLLQEIKIIGSVLKKYRVSLETVYIGGGTPSVLSAEQIGRLLQAVRDYMPVKVRKEWTFEGGRPDTLNDEIFAVLTEGGVDRISINPQTLNENTLKKIGRKHTTKQFFDVFAKAKAHGFHTINCDLIYGLPEESPDDFLQSLHQILALYPENITIHGLSKKRSASLSYQEIEDRQESGYDFYRLEIFRLLAQKGYEPYYLYRQKRTVENGENIGFARKGHMGYYNLAMMSDKRSVIGLGAGSTGKLIGSSEKGIKRMETVKSVDHYRDQHSAIIDNKVKFLKDFFETIDM
ncbi:MAG TPA: coproporphyrinogen dehydrogenase HemZ [Eubacteriaceae bacterium]|nr:coproporphyrinogen dehydrogenase HemZ [Eubacteriaceae bacterium]